jgi:hypothetical protein
MWWSARHPCQAQTKRLRLHDRSDNYLDTHRLPVGLADSYASMRIEIGSAYTLVFLLLIVPVLWAMQAVAHWIESRQGSLDRVI